MGTRRAWPRGIISGARRVRGLCRGGQAPRPTNPKWRLRPSRPPAVLLADFQRAKGAAQEKGGEKRPSLKKSQRGVPHPGLAWGPRPSSSTGDGPAVSPRGGRGRQAQRHYRREELVSVSLGGGRDRGASPPTPDSRETPAEQNGARRRRALSHRGSLSHGMRGRRRPDTPKPPSPPGPAGPPGSGCPGAPRLCRARRAPRAEPPESRSRPGFAVSSAPRAGRAPYLGDNLVSGRALRGWELRNAAFHSSSSRNVGFSSSIFGDKELNL